LYEWSLCHEKSSHLFFSDESGVTAIEYGLIAALISVVIITAAAAVGTQLSGVFNNIAGRLAAAP
jgi:pilus assembly protein Flp/PilA